MSNRAALRIEAVTRGWLTRRRLSVGGGKATTHPSTDDSTGTSPVAAIGRRSDPIKPVEAQGGDSCREGTNDGESGCYSVPERDQAFQETLEQKALSSPGFASRAAPGVATLEDLGAEGVRAFFDALGLGGCADGFRRALSSTAGRSQADGERSAKADDVVDGVELARIAGAADTNAELLALGVRARLHRIKILTALGLSKASPAGKCSSASSSGSTDSPRIPSSTAVAAAAALQMARRLNEEQKAMLATVARIRRRVQQPNPQCAEHDDTHQPAVEVTQAFNHPRNEREAECDSGSAEIRCSENVSMTSGERCVRQHRRNTEGSAKSSLSDFDGAQGSRANPTKDDLIMCSSVSVSLLGELEAAVAEQATLTSQARELLEYLSTNRRAPGASAIDHSCPHVEIEEGHVDGSTSSVTP